MKVYVFVIMIFLCVALNSYSQKHIQVFTHVAKSQTPGRLYEFNIFFVVDSSVAKKVNGFNFYSFTFSFDSTERSGFIAYDQINGNILFSAAQPPGEKSTMQTLFSLKEDAVVKTNALRRVLGDRLVRTVKGKVIFFHVKFDLIQPDSHTIFIEKIEFEKGAMFPSAIFVTFPFETPATLRLTSN